MASAVQFPNSTLFTKRGKLLSTLLLLSSTTNLEYETTVTVLHIIFWKKTADEDKIVNRQEVEGNYVARDEVVLHFQWFWKGIIFFGFKSEPSFSPPSSVWTWQSLSVCLALIVLLVFLVIELDYLPSVLQYLSTRRKHLGDFNYVHFLWVWQCIMFIWKHIIGSHYSIQEDFWLHTTLICKNPYRKLCGRLLDHDDRFKMRIDIGWVLKYWIS